ncbi:hypothetical protein V3481_011415 [Fusarium oxysporum f. sp. vasinfectum]|nr:hypothetical protein FOTG_01686 [Fusarium oxysporum f. sp. vasinfectum 25433]
MFNSQHVYTLRPDQLQYTYLVIMPTVYSTLMIHNQGFTQIGTSNQHFQLHFRMYACMFNTESKPHPIHTIPVLTLTSRYTRKVPVILNHTRSTLPMIPTSFRTHPAAKLVLKHGKAYIASIV